MQKMGNLYSKVSCFLWGSVKWTQINMNQKCNLLFTGVCPEIVGKSYEPCVPILAWIMWLPGYHLSSLMHKIELSLKSGVIHSTHFYDDQTLSETITFQNWNLRKVNIYFFIYRFCCSTYQFRFETFLYLWV